MKKVNYDYFLRSTGERVAVWPDNYFLGVNIHSGERECYHKARGENYKRISKAYRKVSIGGAAPVMVNRKRLIAKPIRSMMLRAF